MEADKRQEVGRACNMRKGQKTVSNERPTGTHFSQQLIKGRSLPQARYKATTHTLEET